MFDFIEFIADLLNIGRGSKDTTERRYISPEEKKRNNRLMLITLVVVFAVFGFGFLLLDYLASIR